MAAYFFFDVREIRDAEKAAAYRARVFDTVAQYDGRYLVLGGEVDRLEGEWRPAIPVVIEFPGLEKARAWYDSDVYRPLKTLRMEAMDARAVLLEGFAPPQVPAGA